jgi:hypothetical protein
VDVAGVAAGLLSAGVLAVVVLSTVVKVSVTGQMVVETATVTTVVVTELPGKENMGAFLNVADTPAARAKTGMKVFMMKCWCFVDVEETIG